MTLPTLHQPPFLESMRQKSIGKVARANHSRTGLLYQTASRPPRKIAIHPQPGLPACITPYFRRSGPS
jgi:hypothetical protein